MSSLGWEKRKPFYFSLVAVIVWFFLEPKFPVSLEAFLSAALNFAAISVGFVVMLQTIIVTMANSEIMTRIRNSGYLADLNGYIRSATYGLLLFSFVNLAGFFLSPFGRVFELVWVFVFVYAVSALVRLTSIVSKIMMKM